MEEIIDRHLVNHALEGGSTKLPPVHPDMVNSHQPPNPTGLIDWIPIPSKVKDSELDRLEQAIGLRFLPILLSFPEAAPLLQL